LEPDDLHGRFEARSGYGRGNDPERFPTDAEIEFTSKLVRGEVKAVSMRHYALKSFFYP